MGLICVEGKLRVICKKIVWFELVTYKAKREQGSCMANRFYFAMHVFRMFTSRNDAN